MWVLLRLKRLKTVGESYGSSSKFWLLQLKTFFSSKWTCSANMSGLETAFYSFRGFNCAILLRIDGTCYGFELSWWATSWWQCCIHLKLHIHLTPSLVCCLPLFPSLTCWAFNDTCSQPVQWQYSKAVSVSCENRTNWGEEHNLKLINCKISQKNVCLPLGSAEVVS